jgi:hypothetical protein
LRTRRIGRISESCKLNLLTINNDNIAKQQSLQRLVQEETKQELKELKARLNQFELEANTRQQQQIAQMKAELETTVQVVGKLLQMLKSVSEEKAANTS